MDQIVVHIVHQMGSSKELIIFLVSMLPIPFILLFIRRILDWMRNTRFVRLVKRIEAKA